MRGGTAPQSWDLGIRHAAVLQQQYRGSITERLADKQRTVWSGIPWATPMG